MDKIKAIIFDMDGVIINSEKIWEECEINFLKQFIEKIDNEILNEILGQSVAGIFDLLSLKYPKKMKNITKDYFFKSYEEFGLQNIYNKTEMTAGLCHFLEKYYKKLPLVIASSSLNSWIEKTLKRHNLYKYFINITSGQEVVKSKPAPDIFFLACKKLKINTSDSLIIEDSKNGIIAAKMAKIKVCGFKNGYNDNQDLSDADFIFDSFDDLEKFIFCV